MIGGADIAKAFLLLAQHPDYKVLRRIPTWPGPRNSNGEKIKSAIYLDTEATGTDTKVDEVIELAMVPFTYSEVSGEVLEIFTPYQAFNEPSIPIPAAATKVNGITDEMVKGHKFNVDEIEAFASPFNLVVAHHAAYDRKMIERCVAMFKDMHWACSMEQVDWKSIGIGSTKLDYIAFRLGYFFDAHRAKDDCIAGINVLATLIPEIGGTALKAMLANARTRSAHVWATGKFFDYVPLVKKREYKWSPGEDGAIKGWHKIVPAIDLDTELAWLNANVYGGNSGDLVKVTTVTSLNRFSERD